MDASASTSPEVSRIVVKVRWRVISSTGGVAFTTDSEEDAIRWVGRFEQHGKEGPYHIEKWQQTYTVSPSIWERLDVQFPHFEYAGGVMDTGAGTSPEIGHLENLVIWLSERLSAQHPNGRLEGIPALLQLAEKQLPQGKRPVEIEAVRLTATNGEAIAAWINSNSDPPGKVYKLDPTGLATNKASAGTALDRPTADAERIAVVWIPTLKGIMTATEGDWIIRGGAGEFYPCKSDIFEAIYGDVMGSTMDISPGITAEQWRLALDVIAIAKQRHQHHRCPGYGNGDHCSCHPGGSQGGREGCALLTALDAFDNLCLLD